MRANWMEGKWSQSEYRVCHNYAELSPLWQVIVALDPPNIRRRACQGGFVVDFFAQTQLLPLAETAHTQSFFVPKILMRSSEGGARDEAGPSATPQKLKIKVRFDPTIQGKNIDVKNLEHVPDIVTFLVKPSTTMGSIFQLYHKRVGIQTMSCRFLSDETFVNQHFTVREAGLQDEDELLVLFGLTGGGTDVHTTHTCWFYLYIAFCSETASSM